jgi:ABC-type uncharacterized transport system permease subunit
VVGRDRAGVRTDTDVFITLASRATNKFTTANTMMIQNSCVVGFHVSSFSVGVCNSLVGLTLAMFVAKRVVRLAF